MDEKMKEIDFSTVTAKNFARFLLTFALNVL